MTVDKHRRWFFYDLQFRENCQSFLNHLQREEARKKPAEKSLRRVHWQSPFSTYFFLLFLSQNGIDWLVEGDDRKSSFAKDFFHSRAHPLAKKGRLNEVKDKIERKIACHLNASLVASSFAEFLLFILIRLKHYKLRWH